ncbi:MAG: hypothetical protein KatS3mg105_0066 [Gemmatales bacterium]|nr:MAG: hypothetical protein KatS3mg105_0066 [Gemmatales bacterium]
MNRETDKARSHHVQTPLEAFGPIITETVIVESETFAISRPDESRNMLDHPVVRAEFARNEFLPYWSELWPAARMLAKAILRGDWPRGTKAIEIGCGLGLPGIAALAKGLEVTFSDYDATALQFAAHNARANGFASFELMELDWNHPPDLRFPVLLLSDLLFERRNVVPIVRLIKKMLAPGGMCLLTDEDRPPASLLREELPHEGLSWTARTMRAGAPGGRRAKGTLYLIRHAGETNA